VLFRSVRTVNLRHDARYREPRSLPRDDNRSTLLPRSFGTSCAALTAFARHPQSRARENRPRARVRCLTRRREWRLRVVACTCGALKRHVFRVRHLPTGGWARAVASAPRFCPLLLKRVWLRAPAGSAHRGDNEIGNNCCLGAAQLTVAPDKTPDSGPAGRAGSFSARRTASRRLQTLPPVAPLVAASGAPPVRSHVDASCG
jgi:hypothetical protein